MSMHTLETLIWHNAQTLFNNKKLKKKDILEWNSGKINPRTGEVTAHLTDPGVYVTIAVEHDKRVKEIK